MSMFFRILLILLCVFGFSRLCLAQTKIDSLLQVRADANHDTLRINTDMLIGNALIKGEFESSQFYYERAMGLAQELSDQYPEVHAEALRQIALAHRGIRKKERAIELLNQAMAIQKEKGLKQQLAYTQFDLAYTYQGMSQFKTAILHYDSVITRNLKDKTDYNLAKACNYSGLCSYYLRKLEPASERILQSIRYYKEFGDTTEIHRPYMVYGLIFKERKQYEEAKEYIKKSTDIATAVGNKVRAALGHKNLGDVLALQDSLDAALETYRKAFEVYSEINNLYGIANYYNNVAYVELKRDNYQIAHDNLEICLEKLTPTTAPKSRADVLRKLADAKVKLANNDFASQNNKRRSLLLGAVQVGTKAWEMVKPVNAANVQLGVAEVLIEAYRGLSLPSQALEFSLEARKLSDAINDKASADAIAKMTTEFETERVESENALLQETQQRQSAQLRQQSYLIIGVLVVLVLIIALTMIIQRNRVKLQKANLEVEKSLSEKELLLKEIHHRVKNNLQVVSSLLDLQSRDIDDEEALATFMEGQNRVKAMALIHQKLYQNDDLATIDFAEYAENLIKELATLYPSANRVNTNVQTMEQVQLDIDTAVPLGLILNELISNAYKYAFNGDEKGELNVSMQSLDKGKHQLTVADTGAGLPEDFDFTKAKSLGLRLVRRLARQLYGSVTYAHDDGAKFVINFTETLQRKAV